MMESKNNNWILLVISLILAFLSLYLYLDWKSIRNSNKNITETVYEVKYDTLLVTDTFIIDRPIPRKVEIVRFDTIRKDTILPYYNNVYRDTVCQGENSAVVEVFTSGLEHRIDSISALLRRQELTREVTITKTIKEHPRITFGLQVGYGIGVNTREFEPFVGVGITYNLWKR